jgi:WD40 repeat protein
MPAWLLTLAVLSLLTLAFLVPRSEAAAPPGKVPRLDRYGDPLPPGAIARLGTARLRHGDKICAIAFSPDGKLLASASLDGTVSLWRPATGKEVRRLQFAGENPCDFAWDSDGKQIVVSTGSRIYRLDALTGIRRDSFPNSVRGLASTLLSPDGHFLAHAGIAGEPVRIFSTGSGKELLKFGKGLTKDRMAFSPDARTMAVAGADGQPFRLWDLTTAKATRSLGSGVDSAAALAFTPDGKAVAEGIEGRTLIRFWDVKTGKVLRRFKGYQEDLSCIVFSPDGKRMAAGGRGGTVSVWDVRRGTLHCTFGSTLGGVRVLAFAPDGKTLAMGGDRRILRLLDVSTGNELHRWTSHLSSIDAVAFSPDGKAVVTAGRKPSMILWDAAFGRPRKEFPELPDDVLSMVFTGDGKVLVSGHWNRTAGPDGLCYTVRTFDVTTGKKRREFPVRGLSGSPGITISPDAATAACGDQDGTVQLWDVATGKQRDVLRGPDGAVEVLFSADGKRMATVVGSTSLGLWDVGGKKELAFHRELSRLGFYRFACSPDGKTLATTIILDKPDIQLWDAASGKKLRTLRGHEGRLFVLEFSPDGKTLASGGEDHSARLWDVANGKQKRILRGHRGPVFSAKFSPGGKRLVTGSDDSTALIWDLSKPAK